MLMSLTGGVIAEPGPAYLAAEAPVTPELRGDRSATATVGAIPEDLLNQYDPFAVLPRKWLPSLREKYIPKTGHSFVDGIQFEVKPRFYYFHRDVESEGIQETAAFGGELGVESGWFRDWFRVGLTLYTSQKIYGPSDRDGLNLLAPGQHGYTALGEAYADFRHGENLLRAGRSRVDLPYINANDFRMTPHTFEMVGFRIASIENLRIGAGHVARIKTQTSTDFESMSSVAGSDQGDRGVSIVSLRYEFSDETFVAASEQYGWDMFNSFYVEAETLIEWSDDLKLELGVQFTDQRSVGDEWLGDFKTQSAGVKVALQYCNFAAALSYQRTANGSGVLKPWGGSPAYNSSIIQDFDRAGEESFRLGLTYDFAPHGLDGVSVDTSWIIGDTPDSGSQASPDQQEFDFTIDYKPSVELFDGVWFRARYAKNWIDEGNDIEDIRFILNYSYQF
ncbi:outer membrane porin, OprD family [Verrucomicrobiaceae bacterium N1E253]|uniref:Outer membrane porin, OprD family n=1 Tax=Oceaniferula marina TaxID=2748318 RepID=A0A851G8R8_9BACT|nr:outer membrane porin, OprD family [Oceaniferula marina]